MKQNYIDFYKRMASEMQEKFDKAQTAHDAEIFAREVKQYTNMANEMIASMAKDFK